MRTIMSYTLCMKRLLVVFCAMMCVAAPVAAQELEEEPIVDDCFDYYKFGSVTFAFDNDYGSFAAGETINVAGVIQNRIINFTHCLLETCHIFRGFSFR